MKKINNKLQFKSHTIRVLQGSELAQVAGAGPTAGCTEQQTICGGCTSHPPQHTPGSNHPGRPGGGQHP